MKTHFIIFIARIQWAVVLILPLNSCKQRAPEIEWQQVYGGNEEEMLINILETPDGGYLLGGTSYSGINGDRTESNRGIWEDYWFVKTDVFGNKQWDKVLGGNYVEHFGHIKQVPDGGYIIMGLSFSDISGDKSESNIGSSDAWVIKTDAVLNKQWDRTLGTTEPEGLFCSQSLSDGTIVLSGSSSNSYDFWMVALDKAGNKIREMSYGGNRMDYCVSFETTSDGGFLLAGISESDVGGDVTKPCLGGIDYWVVKIDSNWIKQWDVRYGGSGRDLLYQMLKTKDGGFILAGCSNSGIENEKSQSSRGGTDYWLVKIDSTGKKLWDKTYGGINDDFLYCISLTQDGGFILAGASQSGKSGEKSLPHYSGSDIWVIKTDAHGNQLWDLVLGGYGDDGSHQTGSGYLSILEAKDGGYIIGGYSNSGISGNKTKPGRGAGDYWVVKLKLEKKKWIW